MGKGPMGILVVESDEEERQAIVGLLRTIAIGSKIDTAEDTDSAWLKIIDRSPDLVLVEYPVKGKTGAAMIKFIQSKLRQTTIAFVAGSKSYAAEAIRLEVYHYLLRPLKKTKVEQLLEKIQLQKSAHSLSGINELIENTQPKTRLGLNTLKGAILINPDEILYCKSDGATTELHFADKSREVTFLYLSQIEQILAPYHFRRIGRSIIVNKNYIRKVNLRSNTVTLTFKGEEREIPGSRASLRELGK